MVNEIVSSLGIIVPVIAVAGGVVGTGYVKASPDKAYIISGLRKEPKVLIGKPDLRFHSLKRKMN